MSTTALLLMVLVTPSTSTYIDYDELGRVRATRGNDGQNVRYTYDDNGNVETITDSLNRQTKFEYDGLDRVVKSTDAMQKVTQFGYDAGDRLVWVKDPRNLETSYDYDGFGQLWSQTSPDTGTTSFQYNAAGQRTSLTRQDGSALSYGYDPLGRPTSVGTPNASEVRSFVYDECAGGKGRLCSASTSIPGNVLTKVAIGYTPEGQVAYTHTIGSGANDITRYFYDGMGRLQTLEYPSGVDVNYGYGQGKLTTMTATLGSSTVNVATSIKYEPFGAVKSWTYGNGLNRLYNHDLDGRLTGISTAAGSNIQQSLTYAYNANDLIEALTNGTDASNSHSYEYDELLRLKKDVLGGGATVQIDTLDAVGNRTGRSSTVSGTTTNTSYTISPSSNQMLGMAGPVQRTLVYNVRGNLWSSTGWQGNRTYSYDAFDRLKSVAIDGTTTNYTINALGQRIGKNLDGTFAKRFVYTGQNQLLAQTTPTGWKSYLWLGGELVGVVQPTSALSYVHTDHLGRPEVATNAAQQPVWKAVNLVYHRTVTMDNVGGIIVGFPGQYWDEDTDTWYNGFRDYDPYTGRYIQSDPIGLVGGLNTYAYVRGNPITLVDPMGLADMILLAPGAPGYTGAQALNPPGVYSIVGHGNPNGVNDGYGNQLTPQQLADKVKADPNYNAGESVELYACRTGQSDYAKKFAEALGATVVAPNTRVGIYSSGRIILIPDAGQMIEFAGKP